MTGDEQLREKLAKVEALFRQAGSPGERAAAGAAAERLGGRLADADRDGGPENELQFSLPDLWLVRLFVAVCRKHGLRPFRYTRQRRTTVMGTGSRTVLRPRAMGRVQPASDLERFRARMNRVGIPTRCFL